MPYVPIKPHRDRLDPHIDIVVAKINELSKGRFDDLIFRAHLQLLSLKWLAKTIQEEIYIRDLQREIKSVEALVGPDFSKHPVWNGRTQESYFFFREIALTIITITEEIKRVARMTDRHAWAGMLNYCSTETLLLPDNERRYHVMSLLKGICTDVIDYIQNYHRHFGDNNLVTLRVIEVFVDVRDEFCRRIMNDYEDEQIAKPSNGDTRGYLKWLSKKITVS